MNGHRISKESICIRGGRRVDIVGKGVFEDCVIVMDNLESKLVLKGDIAYKCKASEPVQLRRGALVIRSGSFYGGEYVLAASDGGGHYPGKLYIKGGTFYGNVYSSKRTYMYKGTITGLLKQAFATITIKGGRIEGGIYGYSDYEEGSSHITITGGKVLEQIILNPLGSLEISGGIIKSSKEAVILAEASPSSGANWYPKITIKGGTVISTAKNGYGIKARQANIIISGGTIKNTTKRGNCGVYNPYYHYDCNGVNESATKKAVITGFKNKVKSIGNDKTCGENVKFAFDENNGTLTIYGKGKMYDNFTFYNMNATINNKTIKNVVVKSGVTYIGKGVFADCTRLKSLKLGSTVKRIGKAAFLNCANLKTVKLNEGLKVLDEDAFWGCSKMNIAKIPSSLKNIIQ